VTDKIDDMRNQSDWETTS